MEQSEATATCDVDLSQLIAVSLDFKSLQIFLRSVVSRVAKLEESEAAAAEREADRDRSLATLKSSNPNPKRSPVAKELDPDLDTLREGLEALKARVNILATDGKGDAQALADLAKELAEVKQQSEERDAELDKMRGSLAKLEPLLTRPASAPAGQPAVDLDALHALSETVKAHGEQLRGQKQELLNVGEECARNASALQEKAPRSDFVALQDVVGTQQAKQTAMATTQEQQAAQIQELINRLDAMGKTIQALEAKVKSIGKERTDDAADLEKLRAAFASLEKTFQLLLKQQQQQPQAGGQTADRSATQSGVEAVLIEDLRNQLGSLGDGMRSENAWMKGQVIEIRAIIEHIHHSKADASLVANKAERDYVENSMEKLMREVEQVLNATNAGLIDTLDKSLNILRDMIDGKATKADITKLQSMIGEEQVGTVPEGLTGFKGYRCLGCNRSLEGMRQRPMGGNFSSFMNRLPNNSRPINSREGVRVPVAPPPTAGYIGAPPGSA